MRSLKSTSSPAAGYDKDTPRKPTLAAASRPGTRPPLTPKIASAASPRAAFSTPGQGRDGVSTVPYIASNVTPRSGTRQSRVDSGNTTPNYGTPTPQNAWDMRPGGLGGSGLSPAASTLDERLRSVAAHSNSSAGNIADSKFFYASDAKSAAPNAAAAPPAPPSLAPPQRAPTFFYASGQSMSSPQLQHQQQQQQQLPPRGASPSLLSSVIASSPPDLSSKFVHANGAALDRPPLVPSFKGPGSVMSTPASSHGTPAAKRAAPPSRAPPTSTATTPYVSTQQRPLSPVKKAPVSPFSLQKRGTFPLSNNNSATRAPEAPTSQPLSSTPAVLPPPSQGPVSPGSGSGRADMLTRRRNGGFGGSIGSNSSGGGHSRKGSLTIADPPTVARLLQSSQPSSETSSPAASVHFGSPSFPFPGTNGSTTSTMATGLAAILQASNDLADADADENGTASHDSSNGQDDARVTVQQETSFVGSPESPPPPPSSSHVDDLVSNARRERKVQDLEITNASLEAINRSLERQLRKQKSELRQFRRLSRSGRLSLVPSSASAAASRVTSGASTVYEGPLQDPDRMFSILSEDDSDGAEDGGYDDGDDYASDMEVSFNEEEADGELAEKDDNNDDSSSETSRQKRRRKRDERRLQLDLSKHRQLLVDSQKINQSIKRCLGWTEALIQEGQKALAFQVRVSEVQLGGRVLAVDELEGDREMHAVVPEPSEGHHLPGMENGGGEQKEQNKDDAFGSVTNGARPGEGSDAGSSQDSRLEAFSPISHKSRNVHFDMDGLGSGYEKNETDERSKDTVGVASSEEAAVPTSAQLAHTTPPPGESPTPATSLAADSTQTPSIGTENDTTERLQTGLAHGGRAEIEMQEEVEPMSTETAETVATYPQAAAIAT